MDYLKNHNIARARSYAQLLFLLFVLAFLMISASQSTAQASGTTLAPLLSSDLVISTANLSGGAEVAFDGSRYLIVWSQPDSGGTFRTFGQFVDTLGALSGTPFVIASEPGERLAIAFNGTHYFVLRERNSELWGRVVAADGSLPGSEIFIVDLSCGNCGLDVASSGSDFLLVWTDTPNFTTNYGDIFGRFVAVDTAGVATLNSGIFAISPAAGHQFNPVVAFGTTRYLVAWNFDDVVNTGNFEIKGALVSPSSGVTGTVDISTAPGNQGSRDPGIAFDGSNFLVVFDDQRDGTSDIYGARVSETGALLDGPAAMGGIHINDPNDACSPHHPKVAFDGTNWIVVWGCTRTRGVRVNSSGAVLDPIASELFVSFVNFHSEPAIASDGTNSLVVWKTRHSSSMPSTARAQLVGVVTTNQPPVAVGDNDSTIEDISVTTDISANDSDPDGNLDPTTVTITNGPSFGTATNNVDGTVTYEPDPDFNGSDSYEYKICDSAGLCDMATVAITVVPVNDTPIATDDAYSTDEDTLLSVPAPGVLAGDSDVDGDTLTAVLDTPPSNGTLTLNSDGSFVYTPSTNFCGQDNFTYHTSDGALDSNVPTVTINVVCVNDVPVASADTYNVNENTALIVPSPGVLADDSDVDGDTLTAVLDTPPDSGTLTLNADGSFIYTPLTGFCADTDNFTYHSNDGIYDSNVATVAINVTCINRDPLITTDQETVTVDEGQTATNSGTVGDPDGDSLLLTASSGTVINNNDGTWSWSYITTDGPSETTAVTITADDGNDGVAITSFNLVVDNVPPTVDTITVPVDPVNINEQPVSVSATFSDPAGSVDAPYTCMVNYGDSSGDQAGAVTGTACTGLNHTYTQPGVYTVSVIISDKDGTVGTDQAIEFIVIYNPEGGFVTGGGWIWSEAGWCYLDDECAGAEGKANFGFVSKYKKGQSVPEGNTEFSFKAGGLNFHSNSYEWLVVNQGGTNAQYKGSGTINGELAPNGEAYKFMIWAQDLFPDDTFRIKIWYEHNGNEVLVYDNGFDQPIGGGNIEIHEGK